MIIIIMKRKKEKEKSNWDDLSRAMTHAGPIATRGLDYTTTPPVLLLLYFLLHMSIYIHTTFLPVI